LDRQSSECYPYHSASSGWRE
jgi:hypothetical protein